MCAFPDALARVRARAGASSQRDCLGPLPPRRSSCVRRRTRRWRRACDHAPEACARRRPPLCSGRPRRTTDVTVRRLSLRCHLSRLAGWSPSCALDVFRHWDWCDSVARAPGPRPGEPRARWDPPGAQRSAPRRVPHPPSLSKAWLLEARRSPLARPPTAAATCLSAAAPDPPTDRGLGWLIGLAGSPHAPI